MKQLLLALFVRVSAIVAYLLVSPLLLLLARTRQGRLIGAAGGMGVLCVVWYLVAAFTIDYIMVLPGGTIPKSFSPAIRFLFISALFGLLFSAVAAGVLMLYAALFAPAYRSDPCRGLSSTFRGPAYLPRWQMALVPEADATYLGVWFVSRLDWRISRANAVRMRTVIREMLDEMPTSRSIKLSRLRWA